MNKKLNPDIFSDCIKTVIPDTYTLNKKLTCDWSDMKNYLIRYRMLKFYVRHGMLVDKVHVIISFRQSRLLEKCKNFITQKRNQAVNDCEKDFYKILNNAFYRKTIGKCTKSFKN